MFYLNVPYVLQWFFSVSHVFLQVFQMHVSSVSSAFKHMLQVLYLDVSKVDWMLYLSPRFLLSCLGVFSSFLTPVGHPPPPPLLLDARDVRC
jgi:hypothetical protein